MSDLNFFGSSPFRIKRPLITTNGIVSGVDSTTLRSESNGL